MPTMNLFQVRLAQQAGQTVLQGQGFQLPVPPWLAQAASGPQQALVVGLRPQTLAPARDQAPAREGAGLPIQVDVVEYLGTESQVVGHLQVPGGQRISAVLPGDAKALLHPSVQLAVDAASLHVFDAESGLSLKPRPIP